MELLGELVMLELQFETEWVNSMFIISKKNGTQGSFLLLGTLTNAWLARYSQHQK